MRLSPGVGPLRSSRRSMPRISRRDETKIVSNKPDFSNRRENKACKPVPSESIATSDATPTEIPIVVSEFLSNDSLRLRTASSVRSGIFTGDLPEFPSERLRHLTDRRSTFRLQEKSSAAHNARQGPARASP